MSLESLTERLANLSIPEVLICVVVLLLIRYVLLKQKSPTAKSVAEVAESLAVAMALVFLLIRPFVVQAFFIPSESMVPTLLVHDHILVNKFVFRMSEPKHGDIIVFKSPKEAGADEADFIKRVVGTPGDIIRVTPGYVLVGEAQYNHADLQIALSQFAPKNIDPKDVEVKLIGDKVLVNGRSITNSELAGALGVPVNKIKIVPGKVFRNGKPIDEPYVAEDPDEPYPGGPRELVKPDQWVVVDKKGQREVKIPKGRLLVMGDNRNDSNDARMWGLLDRKRVLGKAMFIFFPFERIRWIH